MTRARNPAQTVWRGFRTSSRLRRRSEPDSEHSCRAITSSTTSGFLSRLSWASRRGRIRGDLRRSHVERRLRPPTLDGPRRSLLGYSLAASILIRRGSVRVFRRTLVPDLRWAVLLDRRPMRKHPFDRSHGPAALRSSESSKIRKITPAPAQPDGHAESAAPVGGEVRSCAQPRTTDGDQACSMNTSGSPEPSASSIHTSVSPATPSCGIP